MKDISVPIKRLLATVSIIIFAGCVPVSKEAGLPAGQAGYYGVVERVIDGDTVKLTNGERVRYIGIDTPELHHPKIPVQYFAEEAKDFNERLIGGKKVRLEFDVEKRDIYGRLLAYVYADDIFVNAKLIEEGYARIFTFPPNVKYTQLFLELERKARREERGLWHKR